MKRYSISAVILTLPQLTVFRLTIHLMILGQTMLKQKKITLNLRKLLAFLLLSKETKDQNIVTFTHRKTFMEIFTVASLVVFGTDSVKAI